MFSSGIKGGGAGPNIGRVVINTEGANGLMNKAKGIQIDWSSNVTFDSNGYPQVAPTVTAQCNPVWFPNYTGDIILKWSGQVAFGLDGAYVILDGGAFVAGVTPANIGDTAGGGSELTKFYNPSAAPNPRVRVRQGWNIQSLTQSPVSNGAGGFLIRMGLKTNYAGSYSTGIRCVISGQTGQAAATGSWTLTKIDNQTFDLQGSTWNVSDPYTGPSGLASVINGPLAVIWFLPATSGAYSGFSNFVLCKSAHEADVDAGRYWDPDYVSQLTDLCGNNNGSKYGGILRFMDYLNVQSSFECYSNLRRKPADFNWNQAPTQIQVGTITNGGSDNYTCTNPSNSPASGAPADGEVLQGTLNAVNTGINPTLGITGRSGTTFPIILGASIYPYPVAQKIVVLSGGAASVGQTMTFTFTAAYLSGRPGVVGTTYTFNYTTVAGDVGSIANLSGNLISAINADATLSPQLTGLGGAFGVPSQNGFYMLPPTVLAGTLTIAYTAGPAVVSIGTMNTGIMPNNNTSTFVFNKLAQAWGYVGQRYTRGLPPEVAVELCNRTGMHAMINWPLISSSDWINGVTNIFARASATPYVTGGLLPGLRLMTEVINEVWNFAAAPFAFCNMVGRSLGWTGSGNTQVHAFTGLRAAQYAALSKAVWTGAGRAAGDHVITQMSQLGETVGGGWENAALAGAFFVTTNPYYASYGGLNGTAESNRNGVGSRPGTITDAIGSASYVNSKWVGNGSFTNAGNMTGTVAQNAPLLQAAKDYMAGNTATAFTSLVNQYTRVTPGGPGTGLDLVDARNEAGNKEVIARKYDAERIAAGFAGMIIVDYEGAMTLGIGHDGNNGVNSIGINPPSVDISALSLRMGAGGTDSGGTGWTGLNWDVSPYTTSGTNNPTEMATMVLTMLQGWKYDVDRNNAAAGLFSYKNMIKASLYRMKRAVHYPREAHPSLYGYQANNWGVFATSFLDPTSRYQSYDAIKEFDLDSGIAG